MEFNSRVIFLCANDPPEHWYPSMDYRPLKRRIEKIVHFTVPAELELHEPHECENEDDSLDEGEAVGIDGTEETQALDEEVDWDEEEELAHLVKAGVCHEGDAPDSPLVLYDEIPEEVRSEIREGKKEIPEKADSANVIDLTTD